MATKSKKVEIPANEAGIAVEIEGNIAHVEMPFNNGLRNKLYEALPDANGAWNKETHKFDVPVTDIKSFAEGIKAVREYNMDIAVSLDTMAKTLKAELPETAKFPSENRLAYAPRGKDSFTTGKVVGLDEHHVALFNNKSNEVTFFSKHSLVVDNQSKSQDMEIGQLRTIRITPKGFGIMKDFTPMQKPEQNQEQKAEQKQAPVQKPAPQPKQKAPSMGM